MTTRDLLANVASVCGIWPTTECRQHHTQCGQNAHSANIRSFLKKHYMVV